GGGAGRGRAGGVGGGGAGGGAGRRPGPQRRELQPSLGHRRGGGTRLGQQALQQVLAAEPVPACAHGLVPGAQHHAPRVLGEPLEHPVSPLSGLASSQPGESRPVCFLCTACLLTPRKKAISAHDQPCARALPTWSASSRSASSRSARAARSPSAGSPPLAASASRASFAMSSI